MLTTAPTRDPRRGSRAALIVATSSYLDPTFRGLRAPTSDATDLATVLSDPAIGNFQVTSLINPASQQLKVGVDEYLSERALGDLLVVYISGHGVRDARGRLYFVATDTLYSRLSATGVEALWLLDRLEECAATQQVVILDCCFSGAFAAGAKGGSDDLSRDLAELSARGRGRIVLTASRATEYSFEGQAVPGSTITGSVFTAGLIDGLKSSTAGLSNLGRISVEDAFRHACDFVQRHGVNQTPQRWSYGAEGTIWLAYAPRPKPTSPPSPYTAPEAGSDAAPELDVRHIASSPPNSKPRQSHQTPVPQRLPPSGGTVIGWGGRNPSLTRAFATVLEFGRLAVPAGLRGVTAISAGSRHALALTTDGSVLGWGENTFGQTRVPVRRLRGVRAIAAGGAHSLALCTDGTVAGWGNNNGGQAKTPKTVCQAVQVAAGGWHSLALLHDGTVAAWGENRDGQTRVPLGLQDIVSVAAGEAHSLALHVDGTVTAWGRNNYGQSSIPAAAVDVVTIAAGGSYSIALRRDGQIISWGRAPTGSAPRRLEGALGLSAGESHCLALGRDGVLHAWGDNSYEQCDIPHGLGELTAVSAGGTFSLALVAER
ncbi:caspase family protein [Micromonospora soli]|uniref:caspase, EACC1-associated type n=1 Tax=Micromonospora sp. NBRC 110009 TaxID=3061627 RepID=UPI002673C286|nr:caspase family protein [Micromonospora sp. NBRC 110009]WKT97551.1 caspase family protein [Micromonospora sp. NBRC 110009]